MKSDIVIITEQYKQQGSIVMNYAYDTCVRVTKEQVLTQVESLRSAYSLRRVVRWGQDNHALSQIETVCEHTHNTALLADFFFHQDQSLQELDLNRAQTLLRYHDFVEVGKKGDIPQAMKTASDELSCPQELAELLAPYAPVYRAQVESAIAEFDQGETPEARFALACDKLDPSFELYFHGIERIVPPRAACIPPGAWHGWTSEARVSATRAFPLMHRFGNVLAQEIERELERHCPEQAAR